MISSQHGQRSLPPDTTTLALVSSGLSLTLSSWFSQADISFAVSADGADSTATADSVVSAASNAVPLTVKILIESFDLTLQTAFPGKKKGPLLSVQAWHSW